MAVTTARIQSATLLLQNEHFGDAAVVARVALDDAFSSAYVWLGPKSERRKRAQRFIAYEHVLRFRDFRNFYYELPNGLETVYPVPNDIETSLKSKCDCAVRAYPEFAERTKKNTWSGLDNWKMLDLVEKSIGPNMLTHTYQYAYRYLSNFIHPTIHRIRCEFDEDDVSTATLSKTVAATVVVAAAMCCDHFLSSVGRRGKLNITDHFEKLNTIVGTADGSVS